ncbi:MAG: LCP family protein [Thermoleophilia bacterium]|nr:LCP family protein [Thermoleophilia bacterium]
MSTAGERPVHRDASYYRVGGRRGWGRPVAFWLTWLVLALGASLAYGAWAFVDEVVQGSNLSDQRTRQIAKVVAPVDRGEPMNVLLVGTDSRSKGDNGRSDSMILVRLDTHQKFISMLSFPRDSWVDIPGHGFDKLNAAYYVGEQQSPGGGPALLIKTISQLTGQKINAYATVDFKGFVNIVNELGGVYIDVDHYYFHKNGTGTGTYEEIDIPPGYQKLNGDDALDFVRYRHLDSDFARATRQQMFLSQLKRQVKDDLGSTLRAPLLVKMLMKNSGTTISADRRLDVLRFAVETPDSRVYRITAKGPTGFEGDQSVVHLNTADLAKKVQDWLQPPFVRTTQKAVTPASVRVRVLNGSGRALVADDVAAALRAQGYKAEAGGNAKDFSHAETQVLFNGASGKSVSAASGLQPRFGPYTTMTAAKPAEIGSADVVVVVGANWTGGLITPPKPKKAKDVPDVVSTTALVGKFREAARKTGMPLMAPTRVVRQSRVVDVHTYRIGDKNKGPWAVRVVFELPSNTYYPRFWGIEATAMRDVPLLADPVGTWKKGDGLVKPQTYYNGKVLVRDAFTYRGVTYWVTNVMDDDTALSSATVHSVAQSFRPLRRAKLPKGTVDTAITIGDDPMTP